LILKKNFLQGYSEQRKIPALTNWGGGGNILPQYLMGEKVLQNSMDAGIDLTSPRRSLISRD
jgi:hypothetical protein